MASAQPLPEKWVLAPPGETAVPLDRYWTMFDDPLVSEFVARAQVENLDLALEAGEAVALVGPVEPVERGHLGEVLGLALGNELLDGDGGELAGAQVDGDAPGPFGG